MVASATSGPVCGNASLSVGICTAGELFGGVERQVIGLVKVLRECQLPVHVLLLEDGELAFQLRRLGVDPLILAGGHRSRWKCIRGIRAAIRSCGISVLHVHGYAATVLASVAVIGEACPLIKTEHGMPEAAVEGWRAGLRSRTYHLLAVLAAQLSKAHVCYVTHDLRARFLRWHAGLPRAVIPNGVELVSRAQLSCPPEFQSGQFHLLIVGRLEVVKGHEIALQAMVLEGFPVRAHLWMIGDGPMLEHLQREVGRLNLKDRVSFMGFRRDVHALVAHADAVLIPSRHEGLPYVLLEAMMLGVPVVASRIGGLAEVLRDGETGLLVPVGSPEALCRAVASLLDDADLRRQLAGAASRLWQRQYTLQAMGAAYIGVYQAALASSRARR